MPTCLLRTTVSTVGGTVADDRTNESVARTLEFALSDYCIAQMAKALGKTADYEDLMRRAKNYRYLYNPKTKLFQARNADGSWAGEHSGFTEGANWTYQFCVMQDVQGLIDLMGGNESFAAALDNVFDNGHYRHDNEPGHHYVYLYNYCGRFDKAQERIPEILDTHYRNGTDVCLVSVQFVGLLSGDSGVGRICVGDSAVPVGPCGTAAWQSVDSSCRRSERT